MTPFSVDHRTKHPWNKPYTAYFECGRSHRFPKGAKCSISRYNAELAEAAVLGRLWELEADPETLDHLLRSLTPPRRMPLPANGCRKSRTPSER